MLNLNDYHGLYEIIQTDSKSKVKQYTSFNNVYFSSSHNELMIRDNSKNILSTIVLARISLNNKHCGTGTKIIKWLEEYAKTHNAKRVIIESILTEPMRTLALKLDYKECKYSPGTYEKYI